LSQVQAASGDRATSGGLVGERLPWDWNRVLTPSVVLYMLPVVVLTAAAYWHRLVAWEAIWRSSPDWGHGYLIPVFAILIAHFRLKELNPQRVQPCIWGLALILAGLVLRIWSQMLGFGYPGEVTFILVVAGVVLLVLGWDMFKVLWIPVAYLILMIPWNPKYYEGIALPLQRLAAMGTERLLPIFGYTRVMPEDLSTWLSLHPTDVSWVCRRDNLLNLAGGPPDWTSPLMVAGPCAGLHLLIAFVALGVLMAYVWKHPLWERILIIASSIPIAVLCNVIRIFLMAVVSDRLFFEIDAIHRAAATWSTHVPDFFWSMLAGDDPASRLKSLRDSVLAPDSYLHQSFGFVMLGVAFILMRVELGIIDRLFVDDGGKAPPGGSPKADAAPAAGQVAMGTEGTKGQGT
jgi:exosortase/archaeosortase family protein